MEEENETTVPVRNLETPNNALRVVAQCADAFVNPNAELPSPACGVFHFDGGSDPDDGLVKVTFELDLNEDSVFHAAANQK